MTTTIDDLRLEQEDLDVADASSPRAAAPIRARAGASPARAPPWSPAAPSRPRCARREVEVERISAGRGSSPFDDAIDVEAVAEVGRNPARRRVRMRREPCSSSTASSFRTVEDDTSRPLRSTSVFEPTGARGDVLLDDVHEDLLLARLAEQRWRAQGSSALRNCSFCRDFSARSSAVTPPPRKPPAARQGEPAVRPLDQAEPLEPIERRWSTAPATRRAEAARRGAARASAAPRLVAVEGSISRGGGAPSASAER